MRQELLRIDFDPSSNALRIVSLAAGFEPEVSIDVSMSSPPADNLSELAGKLGQLVLGALESALGRPLFDDWSFGRFLDAPKLRRIAVLEERARAGVPDALFEIFGIYIALAVRNGDRTYFETAESFLQRAVKAGSQKALVYANQEWPTLRPQYLNGVSYIESLDKGA